MCILQIVPRANPETFPADYLEDFINKRILCFMSSTIICELIIIAMPNVVEMMMKNALF